MLNRALLTLAILATIAVGPWMYTLALELGKLLAFAIVAPIGFVLGASAVACVMESLR